MVKKQTIAVISERRGQDTNALDRSYTISVFDRADRFAIAALVE